MFLGITAEVIDFKSDDFRTCTFNLQFTDNPLIEYVELPEHLQNLQYSNVICGAIRGALSKVIRSFNFKAVTQWKGIFSQRLTKI